MLKVSGMGGRMMDFREACFDLAIGIALAVQSDEDNEYVIAESLVKPIETFGQAICDLIVNSVAVALSEGGVLSDG